MKERVEQRKIDRLRRETIRGRCYIVLMLALALTLAAMLWIKLDYMTKTQEDAMDQLMEIRMEIDGIEGELVKASAYLGEFKITNYCTCEMCCGEWADGITATGTTATAGRTVAVDPEVIPLGTKIIIEGETYIAEDIGGAIKGNRIDILRTTHQEALEEGVYTEDVYLWWI